MLQGFARRPAASCAAATCLDGTESPVLRVNGLFRGVALPASARQVEIRFEPRSFQVGAGVPVAAALLLAALLLTWRRGMDPKETPEGA